VEIIVAGAGPAGLSAALVLSRAGHRVSLYERDQVIDGSPPQAFGWQRNGVPHFGSPHAFIPRGRKEMRERLPDVYRDLLEQDALEIAFGDHLPQPSVRLPGDEELTYLAVRRQLIEWALRRALFRDGMVEVVSGERLTGLLLESGDVPRVRGVRTQAGSHRADLVVDAGGRRSAVTGWLRQGGACLPEESNEVGLIYYSRYYQVLPPQELPQFGATLGPAGDAGYCAFRCFPGDANTFAFALMVPLSEPDFRLLRHAAAFEAFCHEMPPLRDWVDPDFARPITEVMPMGSLQNTLVTWTTGDRPAALGVLPVSDAWVHTDPSLALGLSNSLIHAAAIADAVARHPDDLADATLAYFANVTPEARERFQLASAIAAGRHRRWSGDTTISPETNLPFFLMIAGGIAARQDADVCRRVVRRNGFLESTAVLEQDQELIASIGAIFRESQPPTVLPGREQVLARLTDAVAH